MIELESSGCHLKKKSSDSAKLAAKKYSSSRYSILHKSIPLHQTAMAAAAWAQSVWARLIRGHEADIIALIDEIELNRTITWVIAPGYDEIPDAARVSLRLGWSN